MRIVVVVVLGLVNALLIVEHVADQEFLRESREQTVRALSAQRITFEAFCSLETAFNQEEFAFNKVAGIRPSKSPLHTEGCK